MAFVMYSMTKITLLYHIDTKLTISCIYLSFESSSDSIPVVAEVEACVSCVNANFDDSIRDIWSSSTKNISLEIIPGYNSTNLTSFQVTISAMRFEVYVQFAQMKTIFGFIFFMFFACFCLFGFNLFLSKTQNHFYCEERSDDANNQTHTVKQIQSILVSSLVLKKNDAETEFSINNQKIYDPNLFHCVPMQSQTYTDDSFRSGQCDVNPYENEVMDELFFKIKDERNRLYHYTSTVYVTKIPISTSQLTNRKMLQHEKLSSVGPKYFQTQFLNTESYYWLG
ncbi:hypothetical protein BpHYR1_050099 [Brachionus plicatilis]|uniref:Uncharacterized protein n=1 Tax=Brachionus plicatilis TaxID=10195 RepID=A0A3M7PGT2_BRAPC|nr:hypothetical protein BpHYR1_050099 [Brachionus plicatilis]